MKPMLPLPMANVPVERQKAARAVGGEQGIGALATLIDGRPTLMVAMRHRDGTVLTTQLEGIDLDKFGHVFANAVNLINQLSGAAPAPATVQ